MAKTKYDWTAIESQIRELNLQGIRKLKDVAEKLEMPYMVLYTRTRGRPSLKSLFEWEDQAKNRKQTQTGIPMEDVLTPEQCDKMKFFLAALATYSSKTDKPDVMKFIGAFREQGFNLMER